VPAVEPDVNIVSLAPTDSVLVVLVGLFEKVKVPTVMFTPPAAMVADPATVGVYAQLPLLQVTVNLPGLPTLLLDRTTPAEAVRAPAALIVILQLLHVGKTAKVPKSTLWVDAGVATLAAACAAWGVSNNAKISPGHIWNQVEPGHQLFRADRVFDIACDQISYS
jgi:hypothetical protein